MYEQEIRRSVAACASVTFSHSGGPGGQNVNKVSTKVTASIHLADVCGLSVRERVQVRAKFSKYPNKVIPIDNIDDNGVSQNTAETDIIISVTVQDERFQSLNRAIAYERLADKIARAAYLPKRRHPTRPTRASKERRLKAKAVHAEVKRNRRHPPRED